MARTPLVTKLADAASAAAEAHESGRPIGEVLESRAITRRRFLRDAGAGAAVVAGASAFGALGPLARAAADERIVVVGAGLAGLTCAYRLKQAGVTAKVYEAADRIGGRCWTLRGAFAEGQIVERGGELIDQGHTHIRQLAQELGLRLDNLHRAEANDTEPLYFFDGAPYTYAEASDDLNGIYQKLHRDVSDASYPTLFDSFTQRGAELDQMSIVDWIEESVPGGMASKFGQLLDVAYNIEYGAESNIQSSLNLIYLLGYSGQGQLRIFGPSNEKYHVRGGNDQITGLMAAGMPGQVELAHELVSIRLAADGRTYSLTFRTSAGTKTVGAHRVVLALPFSILRASVNYTKAGFEPLKVTAIEEQGMGTNSKLQLQFDNRHWSSLGCNGDTFADTGYQSTWDVSRAQPGGSGILVDYTGGSIGDSFGSGTAATHAVEFLSQIEPVLPGLTDRWNGLASLDSWPDYEWTRGSYSFWKVGQYTKFAGMERQRQGNCHFAGEHTSIDFQGYLNGAVESGERAAAEILADLK
jgi:monoamine oxidase